MSYLFVILLIFTPSSYVILESIYYFSSSLSQFIFIRIFWIIIFARVMNYTLTNIILCFLCYRLTDIAHSFSSLLDNMYVLQTYIELQLLWVRTISPARTSSVQFSCCKNFPSVGPIQSP